MEAIVVSAKHLLFKATNIDSIYRQTLYIHFLFREKPKHNKIKNELVEMAVCLQW